MFFRSSRTLIWLSFILSVTALTLIVSGWMSVGHQHPANTVVIDSASDLDGFFASEGAARSAENFQSDSLMKIPTGIFVQSAAFASSTDVNLTGYVWQTYPADFPFTKGFIFPEAVDTASRTITESYRKDTTVQGVPSVLIGWRFDVTVRQTFDYSSYPLDYLNIWLRMWPADWTDHASIIFVPDFDSYPAQRTKAFGLDGDFVQGEWDVVDTYFSYQSMPYSTNFGISTRDTQSSFNEFFFNLDTERRFINAFIINLVPLLIVSLLLFSALMTISSNKEQRDVFGFSASGVLGTCSALFFVVMISHIQVRNLFADTGLVYIEYFYLVLYGMILLVALNAYLFSLTGHAHVRLLHRRDNFLAKVSYWPLLLWSLVAVTWYAL